jgi:hypothetical protein
MQLGSSELPEIRSGLLLLLIGAGNSTRRRCC